MSKTLALVSSLLLLLSPLQKQSKNFHTQSFDDFNACVQNSECQFTCYYHSETGSFNFASYGETIIRGTGVVSTASDNLLITDITVSHKLKLMVDTESNLAMLYYKDYSTNTVIAFTATKLAACTCSP